MTNLTTYSRFHMTYSDGEGILCLAHISINIGKSRTDNFSETVLASSSIKVKKKKENVQVKIERVSKSCCHRP